MCLLECMYVLSPPLLVSDYIIKHNYLFMHSLAYQVVFWGLKCVHINSYIVVIHLFIKFNENLNEA